MDEYKVDFQANLGKVKVLNLIRDEGEITRAEIIKKTRLSAPTITRIIESLSQMNLIKTDSLGSSIGGRPPQLVQFNAKENYVIGIDIDGAFIRAVLSNLAGEFIFEIHIPNNFKQGFDEVMYQVGGLIEKLSARAVQKELKLWGIGIAVSGMVNIKSGIVEYSPIFDWKNVDIPKALSKYTDLKIAIGNVVNLVALGELLYGVGKKFSNFICLNVGYGIGSGIIIDAKLFFGADGIAGEVGHIVVDRNSKRKGSEGIYGTIEALSSGYAIADMAKEQAKLELNSLLSSLDSSKIDAKCVFNAAKNGDQLSKEIIDTATGYLSMGIDTLIKLFNTECVVIYGELMEYNNSMLDDISNNLIQYSMPALNRSVPLVASSFGENAALMGSFSLILEKILQLEIQ